jgi:hypothetical protein
VHSKSPADERRGFVFEKVVRFSVLTPPSLEKTRNQELRTKVSASNEYRYG